MLFAIVGFGEREGEVRVNFGESKFVYDIGAHDWTVEDTAATIRGRARVEMMEMLNSSISEASIRSQS